MDLLSIIGGIVVIGWIPAYFVYWVVQRRREGNLERRGRELREIGVGQ